MSKTAARTGTAPSDGRTTRWDSHKAERRDLILDAAVDAINEFGPSVGVAEIADRAGVPRSVVYRIFTDRDDLDEHVRGRIVTRLMAQLAPTLAPEGEVGAAITQAIETYVDWIVKFPRLHHFLGTGSPKRRITGSRVASGTKTAIAVQLAGLIAAVLRKQSAPTDLAESMAFGMVGLVDGSVNRWLNNPNSPVKAAELAEFLSSSVWHLLESNTRRLGVGIDPAAVISDLV
ncbi:TetR/AcrR family transcriptional regulator [Nocardia sp. IBHARD005]|uniref:TetR/AcrR family transcriptional regulator n=1 Tax=Nocardia sp. IBHARD005 TaxID=3457765 RepID=UPI0040591074